MKRVFLTLVVAVVLHFVAGVINCCLGGCRVGQSITNFECIWTGRPLDVCLGPDHRFLLIEIYLVNIFFWWLTVNVLVFLAQKLNWRKWKFK